MSKYEFMNVIELEECKDRIVYRLISKVRNYEYLKNTPSEEYLDLAVVFYIICHIDENGIESIKIDDRLFKGWGVSIGELMELAKVNTPKFFPVRLESMSNTLSKLLGSDDELPEDPGMMVLSNSSNIFGVTSVLYETSVDDIVGHFGENFYMIPSSVHELIFVPEGIIANKAILDDTIKQINESTVLDEEILSDRSYYYSRQDKRFYF